MNRFCRPVTKPLFWEGSTGGIEDLLATVVVTFDPLAKSQRFLMRGGDGQRLGSREPIKWTAKVKAVIN